MKHYNNNTWLDSLLTRHIHREPKQFDFEKWAEKHSVEARLLRSGSEDSDQNVKIKPNEIWRIIMESKVTRYSAAAVVTLALTLVLFSPFGTPKNDGIVWAKVVENMDKVQMFAHKEHRFYYEQGEDEPFLKTNVIKHICPKYGIIEEQYTTDGEIMHRIYILAEPRELTSVLPNEKKYFKMPLSDGLIQLIDRLTPRGLVEYFMSIEHKELGRSLIDEHEAEGFETTDTTAWPFHDTFGFLFPVKQITWRFWIDVESSLLVRAEYEIITDRGPFTGLKKLKIVCKAYAFEYLHETNEELFEPNIPDDYTELKLTDLIPAEAKAGLVGLGIIPITFILWRKHRKKDK
jgi:hypothetical protein